MREILPQTFHWTSSHPKIKIEVVVGEHHSERVEYAIVDASATGNIGDGKNILTPH